MLPLSPYEHSTCILRKVHLVPLTGTILPLVFVRFYLGVVFCVVPQEVLHLFSQHLALVILLGHEMRPLSEFHLERGVLLLVLLVLLKQGLELLDLLILLE